MFSSETVQSTRPLYEKILSDSIEHIDNIDEYLNSFNFTRIGDEKRSTESTKTTDSGHGNSINLNNTNNTDNTNNDPNNSKLINHLDNSIHNSIASDTVDDLEDNGTTESISTKSNVSHRTNSSNKSIAIESNNFINIPPSEPISSPIVPIIKITEDLNQPNLDNLYTNLHNRNLNTKIAKETNTYCSTPIERILNDNPKRINNNENGKNFVTGLTQETAATISASNAGNKPDNLFKSNNVNRNVFKNFVQSNLRDNTDVRSMINDHRDGLNKNLESKFKTARHSQINLPTTANPISNRLSSDLIFQQTNSKSNSESHEQHPHPPPTTSLQFSDKEDDEESEGGVAYEYKVRQVNRSQIPRSKLASVKQRIPPRFTKSEYLKRTVPNYQTNHPPPSTNWFKSFLLVVLSLLIFSFVLAVTSYL